MQNRHRNLTLKRNSRVVQKRTGQNLTRANKMQPGRLTANEINMRQIKAIWPEPSKGHRIWLHGTPNIRNREDVKKISQSNRTLTTRIRSQTMTIKSPVKNSIKIPTQKGGDTEINLISTKVEELVPIRVSVSGIKTCNPKSEIIFHEMCQNEVTLPIIGRLDQSNGRLMKNHRTKQMH